MFKPSSKKWLPAIAVTSVIASLLTPSLVGADETQPLVVTFNTADHVRNALDRVSAFEDGEKISSRVVTIDASSTQMAELTNAPGVIAVEPEIKYQAADLPNDPCITSPSSCSGLSSSYVDQIGLDQAWSSSHGVGVTIAVLDGGINPSFSDVGPKMIAGEVDYVGDGPSTHGTSVAALAAAVTNNGSGIAGAGWDATIRSYKVLDQNGSGLLSDVVNAITAAADSGVRVINMAFSGPASAALNSAVSYAINKGVVVVAAAGNEANSQPTYPADSPGAIGVGSVTSGDTIAAFSNTGPWVDIYAPGVNLPAPKNDGAIAAFTGTSASAPIVSGIAALMISRTPWLTPKDVLDLMNSTASVLGPDVRRIDAGKAVSTWAPYHGLANGARIAGGNVDGDGGDEIVTGAGAGGGPHVVVADRTGPILGSFYAYDPGFKGGVDVATGDLDGNGIEEVITAAGPGGGPHVRTFSANGTPLAGFFAYDPGFTGGVNIAAGDIDGDGIDEVVTGAGPGGGPNVTVRRSDGSLVASFFPYDPGFSGGVDVATGDLDGDGREEIITGAGPGGGPHVRAFSVYGTPHSSFFAYDPAFAGGVRVSAVDIDENGRDEIVTGAGPGGGPHVTVRTADGTILRSLFAFEPTSTQGIDVGGFNRTLFSATIRETDRARIIP